MILGRLQKRVAASACVSRSTLAQEFNLSEEGIDMMLSLLVRKGLMERQVTTECSGCQRCGNQSDQVIYKWLSRH